MKGKGAIVSLLLLTFLLFSCMVAKVQEYSVVGKTLAPVRGRWREMAGSCHSVPFLGLTSLLM